VLGTELLEAKLQALRMQLNPHFLFNTLNTISALIHDDPSMADRMVVRLGDLLRRTLEHRDAHEVPLRDELSFLRDYLAIEQARFGDRLTATIDVAPETESLYVPFLLLQPLVENAIRHGIEPREEPGHVTVTARRDGNQLELRVVDNGDGLADAAGAPPSEGIGLANTRTRLAYLYEDEHSLELRNGSRGGLEVRVRIPCRTAARPYQPRIKIIAGREASRPDGKCCPNHG
jgi:LytS/YehU family sensor histidine kinase